VKGNDVVTPMDNTEQELIGQDQQQGSELGEILENKTTQVELEHQIQTFSEKSKDITSEIDNSDQGLSFDDYISPGGEHFTFGSFQNVEIKNLWKVETGDNSSTIINEYGFNLFKSKSDPLVAVEAKNALLSGQHSPMKHTPETNPVREKPQEVQVPLVDEESPGKVSIPSSYNST